MALVSARPDENKAPKPSQNESSDDSDPDLKRARDLLALHATFKQVHQNGTNVELTEAREAVDGVMRTLG